MAEYILKIREADRRVFEAIRSGEKTIETRAGTGKYRKIKAGDVLVFNCGKDSLKKIVVAASHFETIDDLIGSLDFKKIMPSVSLVDEAKKVWHSFPGYQEKIKKYGLVAFEIK